MPPEIAIQFGFALLNDAIDFIKRIKAETGMSDDQLAAYAEKQDLQNKDDIKKLLAL
jgi:hypothetical protein